MHAHFDHSIDMTQIKKKKGYNYTVSYSTFPKLTKLFSKYSYKYTIPKISINVHIVIYLHV